MGASTGAAYAVANPGVADVKITQQTGTCTGIVKDATGEGVIGASVVVKGTTNGTITGLDGDFSLSNVKEGDIIVISFVGYATQEIKWTGKPLDVLLKDDTQLLGEVVVTALGLKREEKALGLRKFPLDRFSTRKGKRYERMKTVKRKAGLLSRRL
jgi:iron complex outermembrane receptor protein